MPPTILLLRVETVVLVAPDTALAVLVADQIKSPVLASTIYTALPRDSVAVVRLHACDF